MLTVRARRAVWSRLAAAVSAALAVGLLVAAQAVAGPGIRGAVTALESLSDGGLVKGNGKSDEPDLAAGADWLTFASESTNLDPDDADTKSDIYVREARVTGDLILVSRASGAAGDKGNGISSEPSVSADGEMIAFLSSSNNLGDTGGGLYVRNLRPDGFPETILASRHAVDDVPATDSVRDPEISDNGNHVVFETGSRLHPDDAAPDAIQDIYVRDLFEGAGPGNTFLVSRATDDVPGPDEGPKGNGTSTNPSVSADGQVVAFESEATNLDNDDADDGRDIFVYDRTTSTTTLVSRADGASGAKANATSRNPVISADGEHVLFETNATNLDPANDGGAANTDVYIRDLANDTTKLVSRFNGADGARAGSRIAGDTDVSADGRFVVFESAAKADPDDDLNTDSTFRRDVPTGSTRLISRADGPQGDSASQSGNGGSLEPSVSGDGRHVAFSSGAANIEAQDPDGTRDVYLRTESVVPDNTFPAAPTFTDTVPASPADDNTPRIRGEAFADPIDGSLIELYSDLTDCVNVNPLQNLDAAEGVVELSGSWGYEVQVPDDSTTTFFGRILHANGNRSSCSTTSISYEEDSTPPPPAPTLTGTTPASGSDDTTPAVNGTAQPGATVLLFTTADCSGAPVATGAADGAGSFSIPVTVGEGSTTTFRAKARDATGDDSDCSTTSTTYVEGDPPAPAPDPDPDPDPEPDPDPKPDPDPEPDPGDADPPDPDAKNSKQKLKGNSVKVNFTSNVEGEAVGTGKIAVKGGKGNNSARASAKAIKLKQARTPVEVGTNKIKLKLKGKKSKKKAKKALKKGKKLTAKVKIKVTNADGESASTKARIKLKK